MLAPFVRLARGAGVGLLATALGACLNTAEPGGGVEGATSVNGDSESGTMAADYPEGPYGKEVGDTFPRMTFLDRHGGVVDLADDYQGSLRARIVFATAMWCQPCVGDAEALHAEMLENHPESGSLGVLFEDNHGGEVSAQEAGAYNDAVDAFEFVADPGLAIHAVFEVAASLPRVVVEAVIAIEDS